MNKSYKYIISITTLSIILTAILFLPQVISSTSKINAMLPEKVTRENIKKVVPVPLMLPPGDSDYKIGSIETASKQDNIEIPCLDVKPTKASNTMYKQVVAKPDWSRRGEEIGFAVISVAKYEGVNYSTEILLAEPSPAAAKANVVYGERTVSLSNGQEAYITNLDQGPYKQYLTMIKDNKVIQIATTASEDELLQMGEQVKISK